MMWGKRTGATVLLIWVVGLTSCSTAHSSDAGSHNSTPSTAAPTTIPPTTTTVDPMVPARMLYFSAAVTSNRAIDAIDAKYGSTIPWRRYASYCGEMAAVDEQFAKAIRVGTWPAPARAQLTALADGVAAVAGLEYECAKTSGTSALQDVAKRIDDANKQEQSAVSAARSALGLPIERG